MSRFIKIHGVSIPRVFLGSSPFIGAGQFGVRSLKYLAEFYGKPWRIAELIIEAYRLGVSGFQALPYRYIVEAVKLAEKMIRGELIVIGSVERKEHLELYSSLNLKATVVHGGLTDRLREREILELIDESRSLGVLSGVSTHNPYKTLSRLLELGFKVDLVMIPFNKLGYMMDSSMSNVLRVARRVGESVFGMKVLAAGKLRPEEALKFAFKHLDAVVIGAASKREVNETFKLALDLIE